MVVGLKHENQRLHGCSIALSVACLRSYVSNCTVKGTMGLPHWFLVLSADRALLLFAGQG
jgi:hypothetical protein